MTIKVDVEISDVPAAEQECEIKDLIRFLSDLERLYGFNFELNLTMKR